MILPFTPAGSFKKPKHITMSIWASCFAEVWFALSHSVLKKNCYNSPVAESEVKMNCDTHSHPIATTEKAAEPKPIFKPFIQAPLRFAVQSSGVVHTYGVPRSRYRQAV